MPAPALEPPFDQFLVTAHEVSEARAEVDPELAREVFLEAATLLDNGLALDGLDEHDAHAVVASLCVDLVASDPGEAVRARARLLMGGAGEAQDLHDPESVARSLLISASILQL